MLASDCQYVEWANERRDMAFVRRHDIMMLHRKGELGDIRYSIHPDPEWDLPFDKRPGQHWINQNTFVDMESFAPVLDGLMQKAGIPVMRRPQQRA